MVRPYRAATKDLSKRWYKLFIETVPPGLDELQQALQQRNGKK